jgi:IclR family transcriptional regulator, KDG regulon repressor
MTNQNYTIVAVERALRVLLKLANESQPVGITDLSQSLGLSKVAIFRIMNTLMASNFVIQDRETSLYELGPSVLRLAESFQIRNTLLTLAQPCLEELAEKTKEVANLGIIHEGKVFVLKSVLGRPRSRFTLHLGPVADIHSSSIGKAILADKSHKVITDILGDQPLQKYTSNTKTNIKEFINDLDSSKESGVYIDDEETEEGLMCVGAPVRDWNNNIIAAISVSGLKSRLIEFGLDKIKESALQTSMEISQRIKKAN